MTEIFRPDQRDYSDSLQSTEVYKRAVKNLNRIADNDMLENIATLDDLSFAARFVSQGMQAVLSVHGRENENIYAENLNINRSYYIDHKSDEKKIYASAIKDQVYFGLNGE